MGDVLYISGALTWRPPSLLPCPQWRSARPATRFDAGHLAWLEVSRRAYSRAA